MFFSIIVPLYNRPKEIDELLDSLTDQTYQQFEVLVIEDGSMNDAREIVESYKDRLDVHYYYKENVHAINKRKEIEIVLEIEIFLR